jgi:predicted negative regulator of RcsB-dependent stress response
VDPFTVITTALIAGAAAGGQDAASATVRDVYQAIRRRISRSGDDSQARAALEANEATPGGNVAALEAAVISAVGGGDSELQALAAQLLKALPIAEIDRARHVIDLRHAQVAVQSGDNNTQNNTFN